MSSGNSEPFYVRYYSGHQGRFGHEFLEFDFRVLGDGRSASARYANNSNYRNDSLIRKEMCVSDAMVAEIKRIVKDSEILKEDDTKWPQKNKDGRQELEIRIGNEHISFETAKIGSLQDVQDSSDPDGLRVFYYLVQDLKALVFTLISLHFKVIAVSTVRLLLLTINHRSSLYEDQLVTSPCLSIADRYCCSMESFVCHALRAELMGEMAGAVRVREHGAKLAQSICRATRTSITTYK
ncbi:unnamed protein product [Periconia digitata]|uniref:Mago nashi n=1 Tax=Periconia digitata TaxID=1303443 RepID=A0A9W4U2M0_9PLEO|nr:unnamed protein product [Periconia digitata]